MDSSNTRKLLASTFSQKNPPLMTTHCLCSGFECTISNTIVPNGVGGATSRTYGMPESAPRTIA